MTRLIIELYLDHCSKLDRLVSNICQETNSHSYKQTSDTSWSTAGISSNESNDIMGHNYFM